MKRELEVAVSKAVQELYALNVVIELTRPEEKFGDYATNIALQLSKELGKNPREIADEIIAKLEQTIDGVIDGMTIAGPGFINLCLADKALIESMYVTPEKSLSNKTIVAIVTQNPLPRYSSMPGICIPAWLVTLYG